MIPPFPKDLPTNQTSPQAMQRLRESAEQGNAESQFKFGFSCLEDDVTTGIFWLEQAAEQDYIWAQRILAVLYSDRGEHQKAHYWAMRADITEKRQG